MSLNAPSRPNLSEDEIDDLLYFARTGETEEFSALWKELCEREKKALGGDMELDLSDLLEVARDEESGNGVLHMAAGNNHIEFLTQTLSTLSNPIPQTPKALKLINTPNKSGNTPLHWAAVNGHLECVKKLMEAGADPTVRNSVGHDAIYEAEVNGKGEVVEWALREGGEGIEEGLGGGDEKMDGVETERGEDVDGDVEGEEGMKGSDEEMEVDGEDKELEGRLGVLSVEEGEGDEKGKGKA